MCVPLVVLNVKKEWKTEDEEKDRLRKERRGGRGRAELGWLLRAGVCVGVCFLLLPLSVWECPLLNKRIKGGGGEEKEKGERTAQPAGQLKPG